MILTLLTNIDNLNLSKIEPLWSLMTKGREIKILVIRGEVITKGEITLT
jgi:hypothetical protein